MAVAVPYMAVCAIVGALIPMTYVVVVALAMGLIGACVGWVFAPWIMKEESDGHR